MASRGMVVLHDVQGIARKSGLDVHGNTWTEFEVDYFAEQEAGECTQCGATLDTGWMCLDMGGEELCADHVELLSEPEWLAMLRKGVAKRLKVELDEDGKLPSYAWPGGYSLVYYVQAESYEGIEPYCPECVNADPPFTAHSLMCETYDEGPTMWCAGCNRELESTYGDPSEPERED